MDKQSTQLLRSLLDPRIAKFVDWRKFLASPEFRKIAQEQINHFVKHGDSTFIKAILEPLKGHVSFKPILLWFCDSAGLDFSFSGASLTLRRASKLRSQEGDLEHYMCTYSGTARDLGGLVVTTPSRQQVLSKLFNPEGRRGGSPYVQGGAPGLGKRS